VTAVDPQFVRIMIRVCAIGLFISGLGATALFIAFRAYGTDKPREYRGALWIAALLAFIIVGCLVLLRLSFLTK
jgi:hypothetical protein